MASVLIAALDGSVFTPENTAAKDPFQITTCSDGRQALSLLRQQRPDALVIDLRLPYIDGLTVLQSLYPHLPDAVIALAPYISPYVERTLSELGVGYVLLIPTSAGIIFQHLRNMLQPGSRGQRQVMDHLRALGVPVKADGYQQLLTAIPLYAKDPNQRLSRQLYPAVSQSLNCAGAEAVERSIRTAIHSGWRSGDRETWIRYFPNCGAKQPTNKEFISTLSQLL